MPTLAERLGFAADDRLAIVHADDIGMCHAANEGAFEALANGPASCGSIMVPCPWFSEAAAVAQANPEYDLGVHLTLNCEWEHYRWGPVASRSEVPTLLDADGMLPRTSLEVAKNAKPEEVHVELRAQVQRALDAGIDVTHIDSHMGTVFFPQFIPVYRALSKEFRLPVFAACPSPEAARAAGLEGALPLLRQLIEAMDADGVPVMDHFDADSLGFEPEQGEAHNAKRIAGLQAGVNYLICHPAKSGEELATVTPDSHLQRDFERRYYGGAPGAKALEGAGVRTLGMRPLRDLLRGE